MSSERAEPADPSAPPASRLWWAVPAVGFVLLTLVAMVFGGGSERVDFGTSYDASDRGFRGVYLLLEELRYPVERSRRSSGGEVRWVLAPGTVTARDAANLGDWVTRGGILLLAPDDSELADQLGLHVTVRGGAPQVGSARRGSNRVTLGARFREKGTPHPAEAPDVTSVLAGEREVAGPPGDRTWGKIDGHPLVTVYHRGRGEIWLLHRPDVFSNANLREADNAVLACRLADAMLRERPGGRLAFDEYCHGLRDRPSVTELLFRPPVLGVTLQVLALAALALWHYGPRFGPVRTAPPAPRRSKEEFLDALAELLARNGDRPAAFRTVRDALRRRLEGALGLPAGTAAEKVVAELARRRGIEPGPLLRLLSADHPPEGPGAGAFLAAIRQLESAAHECLRPRRGDH
jgi:hypothetical protein